MKEYVGLRAADILEFFPRHIPCDCLENETKLSLHPKFNIMVDYTQTTCEGRGRKIYSLRVACDCCGSMELYHVERLRVYENDISW